MKTNRQSKESLACTCLIMTMGTALCSIPAMIVWLIKNGHNSAAYVPAVFIPALLILLIGAALAAFIEA